MKRLIIILLLIVAITGAFIAFQQYNKKHEDLAKIEPDYKLDASELFEAYNTSELTADSIYLNKVIEIKGKIAKIESSGEVNQLFLESDDPMFGINADLLHGEDVSALKIGDQITVRGICSGFLMDVALSRSVILE